LISAAVSPAQTPPSSTIITTDDLVKLSEEKVGDELIITMIQAADRVPSLSPQDVIALRQNGVSSNVLTAVIQHRLAVSSGTREKAADQKHRRIRVTASLHPQDRSWWRLGGGSAIDRTVATWSLQASSWNSQENIPLPAEPKCPKYPLCTKWAPETGKCLDPVPPDSEKWKKELGCYLPDQATTFGQEYEIFDAILPEPVGDVEVRIYYRGVDHERGAWFTRSAAEATGDRVPGYIKLRLWGSDDFNLKMHVQLFMSRNGFVQDFKISECEVANRDEKSLDRRLMSQQQRYCSVVASAW